MGYTSAQAKEFINHIAPMMKAEAKKRGYKVVSVAIAQAIIEGAAGTSILAKKYHNHFGMKCGTKWKGKSVNLSTKEEYKVGTLTTIKDNFRAYDSDEEGVSGYYDFIGSARYENLKTATTPRQYAERLKADGYATSSTYVNTLISTVAKYDLARYDEEQQASYYDAYNGNSEQIDEVLKAVGVPDMYTGTYKKRKPIAEANGIVNYIGSEKQNKTLIQLAKGGQLRRV